VAVATWWLPSETREHPTDPVGPAKRVMCIDYSIGRRVVERTTVGKQGPFRSALAAYRLRDDAPGEVVFSPV